jgi:predicted O-methyltransferase YrrM
LGYPESIPKPGFHTREITNEAASLLPYIPNDRDVIGVEVGVYLAKTASILLYKKPRLFLHLVDSFEILPETKDIALQHLAEAGANGRYQLHHGDSTAMADEVEDASCDYVFIDASKEASKYYADIDAWLPKIKWGGFMQGHDWHMSSVPPVVREVANELGRPFTVNEKRCSWMIQL